MAAVMAKWGQKRKTRRSQAVHDLSTIEKRNLKKMAEMPDCCMCPCSQQFTIKCGAMRLRVSQLSGKETK
jgi:hypothetical protein